MTLEWEDELFIPRPPAKRPRHRRAPEAKVQKEIAGWLMLHGVLVAVTDAGIARKLGLPIHLGVPEGWPDLSCCLKTGRFLGVECKAPKGRQSEAQKEWERRIRVNNGVYILAHSFDEFFEQLKTHEFDFPG